MSAHQRRLSTALSRYRLLASSIAGVGVCLLVAGALVGMALSIAIAVAAMGALLVVATAPLFSRAATLERQLVLLETAQARVYELQAAARRTGDIVAS